MLTFKPPMTKTSPESEAPEGKPITTAPEWKGKRHKISKSRMALSGKNIVQVIYRILNFLMVTLKNQVRLSFIYFHLPRNILKITEIFLYTFFILSL